VGTRTCTHGHARARARHRQRQHRGGRPGRPRVCDPSRRGDARGLLCRDGRGHSAHLNREVCTPRAGADSNSPSTPPALSGEPLRGSARRDTAGDASTPRRHATSQSPMRSGSDSDITPAAASPPPPPSSAPVTVTTHAPQCTRLRRQGDSASSLVTRTRHRSRTADLRRSDRGTHGWCVCVHVLGRGHTQRASGVRHGRASHSEAAATAIAGATVVNEEGVAAAGATTAVKTTMTKTAAVTMKMTMTMTGAAEAKEQTGGGGGIQAPRARLDAPWPLALQQRV
jgi:hypothetical protein